MAEPKARTWFGPVVLAGLGSAALLAVAAARDWFHLGGNRVALAVPESELRADMPLALALALVILAAWGVVLVTGSRARRFVLVLAALAAVGVVVCVVLAPFTLPDQIRSGLAFDGGRRAAPTAAYVVACVAVVLSLGAALVALVLAPTWPTMSSRYDAPTARPSGPHETDLWKALDEGRDPTEAEGPPAP
jgi:Na+/melibiose symporter-like transporter